MKKILFFLTALIIFLLSFDTTLQGEEYLSDKIEVQYDVNNGLLTGKANTICQTEDGYIWIGQYAGLTKFDNKNFTTLTNWQGYNLTAIVTLATKGNILFIGSEKGFFIKDENNILTKVETSDASLVVKDIKIWNDYALVGTTSGLYKYDINNKKILRENSYNVSKIAILNDEVYYYIVGKNSVYCKGKINKILEGNFKSICCDNNKLFLGTRTGYVIENDILDDYSISNTIYHQPNGLDSTVNDILIKDNNLYICADDGFYYGNKNNIDLALKVKNYNKNYNGMEKSFFDYEGNLWLTSSSNGVYKISSSKVTDYFFEYGVDETITYAIEKFHGYTFIGTRDGLIVVSDEGKRIEIPEDGYSENIDATAEEKALMQMINVIGNRSIRDIEVYKNNIYFATYGTNGILYYFSFDNIGTDNDVINLLYYDDLSKDLYKDQSDESKDFRSLRATDDYLFIGLVSGVSRYDESASDLDSKYKYIETNVYPLYMTINGDSLYIVLNTIGVGEVLISHFNNLERIDKENTYSTLKCMYINDGILFSDNNDLYFSKNNKITKLNTDVIGSVVELFYLNDKYYVCSDAAIYIYDDIFSDNPKYDIIDSNSGLRSSLVANSSGYYDSENQKYYYSTSTGVYVYNFSDSISQDKILRKISIDTVYVDGNLITEMGNINLKSSNNNLTINFSILSFKEDQNYNVYYKLDGYDKDYQKLSPSDSFQINYKNLEGGSYSFELYTEDFDGTLSLNSISFNVNKDKKITEYEAFWIILSILILLVIVLLVILFYRNRIKKSIKRQNEYKAITLESIEAIARTIDAKDSYTNGHSKRVGIYAKEIAKALNLSEDEIDNIYYIALLHDIGKISIPISILNKPGRLTDEEFEIMKTHTTAGGKILEGISTIPHIVEGAKYHHERYGGGGYPEGLKGEEIPYIARIICCADCFDAMATRRVYKEPYPKEKIISEFERCSETQFDPEIAKIVIELIKEGKLKSLD